MRQRTLAEPYKMVYESESLRFFQARLKALD